MSKNNKTPEENLIALVDGLDSMKCGDIDILRFNGKEFLVHRVG